MQSRNKSLFHTLKKLILFTLLLYSALAYSGGTVRVKGRHTFILVPFVGALWQQSFFDDVALAHAFDIHYVNHHPWHTILVYSKLGAEFNFNFNKHELWAPKFSSEFDYRYFCLRGNIEDYLGQGGNNPYFTPEFGLTLSGFITLTGGYNIPLTKTLSTIPSFRISLNLLVPVAIGGSQKNK